jgi:dipeptidyl aminopeptidase/acylaminoacyl peptidase
MPADEAQATAMAEADRATLQQVAITANDGVVLSAWYIRPAPGNGDAVILLHGQADNRAGMLGPAALLLRHGYSVLIPDARAQGMSGGDLATYGIKEADDLRRWFDWLAQMQAPRCIDGLGNSMGAAQLLQSLNTERGFCAVVAESPFASFREASYDRIGEWLGAGPRIGPLIGRTVLRPVVDIGFLYVRWKYAINLAEDDPAQAVANSQVPVFLIHGLLDDNLPPRNSEMIVAESRGRNNVVLWELPDAGHTGAASAEPQEYERRVIGWLQSHQTADWQLRTDN